MKQQWSHYRIVGTVDQTSRLIRDTRKKVFVMLNEYSTLETNDINGEGLNARGCINSKINTAKIKPLVLILVALISPVIVSRPFRAASFDHPAPFSTLSLHITRGRCTRGISTGSVHQWKLSPRLFFFFANDHHGGGRPVIDRRECRFNKKIATIQQ